MKRKKLLAIGLAAVLALVPVQHLVQAEELLPEMVQDLSSGEQILSVSDAYTESGNPPELDEFAGSGAGFELGDPAESGNPSEIDEFVGSGAGSELGDPAESGNPSELDEFVGSGAGSELGDPAESGNPPELDEFAGSGAGSETGDPAAHALPEEGLILSIEEISSEELPEAKSGDGSWEGSLPNGMLTEAAAKEAESETEEMTDETAFVLADSGTALAARPQYLRSMAASYGTTYGAQLSGESAKVYARMQETYVTYVQSDGKLLPFPKENGTALGLTYTLSEKQPFTAYPRKRPDGSWDLTLDSEDPSKKNEEYQRIVHSIMQPAFDAFVYDHPEIFWIDGGSFVVSYTKPKETVLQEGVPCTCTVSSIRFLPTERYGGAASETAAFVQAVQAAAAELWRSLSLDASREDQVRAIHDYVCTHASYGESAACRSAAGVFLKGGTVVCEGYAKAVKVLCDQFGIPAVLVPGEASPQVGIVEGHMWNHIKMPDGAWYLLDATWDDQETQTDRTYFLAGSRDPGFSRQEIGQERQVYQRFSPSQYTKSFGVPAIAASGYVAVSAPDCTHDWQEAWETAPTCTTDGVRVQFCAVCEEKRIWTVTGSALGHSFVSYGSDGNATALRDGTKTSVCERCRAARQTLPDPGSRLKPKLTLNVSSLRLQTGQSFTVKATNLAKGDSVKSWKLIKKSGDTVAKQKNGRVTALKKAGKADLVVTLASGLKKTVPITVQKTPVKTTALKSVPKKLTLDKGKKAVLRPVRIPLTSREKLTYSSSNKKVATVSSRGVITAKGAGKAKITVKSGQKKVYVSVTVRRTATKKLSGVPESLKLKKGRTKTLKVKKTPSNSDEKITFRSSNKKVAVVSAKGKITAKKKGTAIIYVKSGKISAKCKVTVR